MTIKKTIVFIALLSIGFSSFSQSTNKLDEQYGFGIFKLGTSPYNYPGKLQKIDAWSNNPNVSGYIYIGNGFNSYDGIPIMKTVLSFFQNKLMTIQINFSRPFTQNDYNVLYTNFNNLYGKGIDCQDDCGMTPAATGGELSNFTGATWNDYNSPVWMLFHRAYSNIDGWCGMLIVYEGKLWQQRRTTDNY